MIIRRGHFIISGIVFFMAFFYLHQSVNIYVSAYQLRENYMAYNNSLDKRDYLRYNFSKAVSLDKINKWAQDNNFSPVEQERVVALNLERKTHFMPKIELAALFDRVLGIATGSAQASTQEGR